MPFPPAEGGKKSQHIFRDCQCSLKLLDCLDTSFWIEPAAFTPFFWYCYFTPYSCQKKKTTFTTAFSYRNVLIKHDVTVFFFYSEWQIKFWFFFVLNFLSTILLTELADCNPKCIKVCMYVCIYTNKAGTLIQKYCGTLFLNFYLLFFSILLWFPVTCKTTVLHFFWK